MRAMGARFQAFIIANALSLTGSGAACQSYSPFSDFQALSPPELASLQSKITYLGPLDYPIQSLAFGSTEGILDLSVFTPYRRSGWEQQYGMDDFAAIPFQVPSELLQALIDSVAALPGVTDAGVDSAGYVSFALAKTAGGTKVFESIIGAENGRALMREIEEAFSTDPIAVRLTRERACDMSLTYDDPPEDVSSQVEVKTSGFRRVRGTDTYVASVRVTNISEATIPSPLTLLPRVMGMGGVELLGESGYACRIRYGGAFVDLPAGSGGLAPGAYIEVVLRVSNSSNQRLEMSPAVFAGPGTR